MMIVECLTINSESLAGDGVWYLWERGVQKLSEWQVSVANIDMFCNSHQMDCSGH